MSDWPTELELAMTQAGVSGPPPPVDPPLPPTRPGEQPTHKGDHVYEFRGDSKTQPYTHVWGCSVVGVKSGRACGERRTLPCTKFTDRYAPCECFGKEVRGEQDA
jgi:hypothetical protein